MEKHIFKCVESPSNSGLAIYPAQSLAKDACFEESVAPDGSPAWVWEDKEDKIVCTWLPISWKNALQEQGQCL